MVSKQMFTSDWSYTTGAITLAILNTLILLFNGNPWGIMSTITNFSAKAVQAIGLEPQYWSYYADNRLDQLLWSNLLTSPGVIINLGLFMGILISSLLAKEFRIKPIRSKKQVLFALLGGIMMGYGARLAMGCNIGAFLGSISSFSLHGWLFAASVFFGTFLGTKLIMSLWQ
ncbi:hypothetical protein GGQ84_000756 [Desulfitispora alkaliphila]|uniref:YeeE/YedE thiosulfate transporter family protein n=1 Tax=Desulfitispora alkaliphila TaxID=622674 RepID=UPI003D202F32